jgi:acetyl-CoA carboxylase carboxyltransferase component
MAIDIKEELAAVDETKRAALDAARPEAVAKQHTLGKLMARERLDLLVDPGTFLEYGVLAKSPAQLPKPTPADGIITGLGKINGREVAIASYDFTVYGGSQGRLSHRKIDRIQHLAIDNGIPMVYLCDGGGARAQELGKGGLSEGGGTFVNVALMAGWIPQVCAIMGPCFAGHANLSSCCDFVPMVQGTGSMGMAGPPLIRASMGIEITKEELGGSAIHCDVTGMADYAAPDEKECLLSIREFLSYLPQNANYTAPRKPTHDPDERRDPSLATIMPDNPRRAYDMRALIASIVDDGYFFELKATYAANIITALASMGSHSVGIIANNPQHMAGILDTPASDKMSHFINMCDAFSIPLVFLVDVPGFVGSAEAERTGLVRHSGKVLYQMAHATVPIFTVIVRKAYGLGYLVMGSRAYRPNLLVAWPTAEFGGMGLEGAVEIMYPDELAKAENRAKRRDELTEELRQQHTARRIAQSYGVDDVIHPSDTRPVLIQAIRMMGEKLRPVGIPPKKRGVVPW